MAKAGRTGGVDAAREAINVISALNVEGDEVNPSAIASRMRKTPEEVERFMNLLVCLSAYNDGFKLCPEFDEEGTPYFVDVAAGRPLRLTEAETLAVQAALAWMGTPADDPLVVKVNDALGAREFDGEMVSRMLAPAGSPEVDAIRRECASAIARGLDLRIVYRKVGSTLDEERQVGAARLRQDNGDWYLTGTDRSRNATRSFKLERISKVEGVEAPKKSATTEGEPASRASELRQVTLTFDSRHWLELLPWHDLEVTSHTDGTLTAKTPWYGGMWLPRMIAACGGHVTCDDPEVSVRARGLAAAELRR